MRCSEKTRNRLFQMVSGCCLLAFAITTDGHNTCNAGPLTGNDTIAVSPADEIQIIMPGTSREMRPEAVVTEQNVEIPPTILVHKYYYSGDRDFRAPSFPGGPTLVVVQSPETGQQLCLEVQMPAGSPRVFYRRHWIDYHFGKQVVRIQFCNPLHLHEQKQPVVKYMKATADLRQPAADCSDSPAGQWIEKTGLPSVAKGSADTAKSLADSAAGGIHTVGTAVLTPFRQVRDSTILSRFAKSNPEAEATRARDAAVQKAQRQSDRLNSSIPTLR